MNEDTVCSTQWRFDSPSTDERTFPTTATSRLAATFSEKEEGCLPLTATKRKHLEFEAGIGDAIIDVASSPPPVLVGRPRGPKRAKLVIEIPKSQLVELSTGDAEDVAPDSAGSHHSLFSDSGAAPGPDEVDDDGLPLSSWEMTDSYPFPHTTLRFGSTSTYNGEPPSQPQRIARHHPLAQRKAPSIQGLFCNPNILLPEDLEEEAMLFCMKTYFSEPGANQVMLFGRFQPPESSSDGDVSSNSSTFPAPLQKLLDILERDLASTAPRLPQQTYDLLFPRVPTMARQAIINLYKPGEGITPHVDLLGRYGDGIMGVSFGSGCVMRFDRVNDSKEGRREDKDEPSRWDLFLRRRSVVVLSEDARYGWAHGIDGRSGDWVIQEEQDLLADPEQPEPKCEWLERGVRMSITYRWLLPGADIVGE